MKLTLYRIKLALGAFRKFSVFVCTPTWLPQTSAFHWKGNSWKSFHLTSWMKRNQRKEPSKLIQNDLGTILIGWIVAEIFDLENKPKLLAGPNQHLFDMFSEIQNAITQRGSPRSTWFMGHFESVFRALFDCMIGFLLRRNYKKFFSVAFALWPNAFVWNGHIEIKLKFGHFRNAPKAVLNLHAVSFICTKFGTFTIFSAITTKGSTYLPDHNSQL